VKKSSIPLIIALILSGTALGQEASYIRSDIAVTMRGAADTTAPVVRGLRGGTKLTVLEIDEGAGFARVRLDDGTEGWVQTRHIGNKPGPQQQLDEALATIDKLRAELKKSEGTGQSTVSTDDSKAQESENNILKAKIIQLETELQSREQKKDEQEDRSARNWFLTGTGVMLLGIMIGIIIPRMRWRRRSSWSEL